MQARDYFIKFPVKTVNDQAGGVVEHNEEPTMGIYTDSLKTALATVYAAATGGTTKTNPVSQNVGGNNSFEGYLTAGQPYYWRIGDVSDPDATVGEFFAATDTYPSGVELGTNSGGTATGTSELTFNPTNTKFRTDIYRNDVRLATILRYGTLLWDNDNADYIKDDITINFFRTDDYDFTTGAPKPQSANNISVYPVFFIDTLDESFGGRAGTLRDNSQAATLSMGRSGNNGTSLESAAVVADTNLSQILTQGDARTSPETSYHDVQAAMYVLTTGNFSVTSKPTQYLWSTSAVNDYVANPNGHFRFGLFDDGGTRFYPQDTPGTISYNGLRSVANMLTVHNDAGVLKQTTFAGTTKSFALLPTTIQDYTVTNPSTSRTLDVSAATLAELRAVVGTMVADLITFGVYQ